MNVMVMVCEARLRNHGHWFPFETCGFSRCPRKCSHTRDCERELDHGGKSRKTAPTRGRRLLPIRGMVQALLSAEKKNNVFVSYRGRVTKVAPECLRKASVVEQMSWDITTKEKVR